MRKSRKTNRRTVKENIRPLIISALENDKWDYRTIDGIAAELKVGKDQVATVISSDPGIRQSIMRDAQGRHLYTTKKRKSRIADIYSAFQALNSAKVDS
jgi:hypothetical protein